MLPFLLAVLAIPAWSAPKIAVVIDDFGLTYPKNVPDEKWMAIDWPITYAVMPESPRTTQAAKRTKETGHELIIHFPFDPFLTLDLKKDTATPGDLEKVEKLMEKAFKQIPNPKGLNNHRSFFATKNQPLMEAFMKRYKTKNLYFLDSKVSPKTVAYDEARKAGIPAAKNYIFLEEPGHYNDKPFVLKIMRQAAEKARKDGEVIVIGHHYWHGTYQGLVEAVPKLKAEGFEFVFASALAR